MILTESQVEKYVAAFEPALYSAIRIDRSDVPPSCTAQFNAVLAALIRDVANDQYKEGRYSALVQDRPASDHPTEV